MTHVFDNDWLHQQSANQTQDLGALEDLKLSAPQDYLPRLRALLEKPLILVANAPIMDVTKSLEQGRQDSVQMRVIPPQELLGLLLGFPLSPMFATSGDGTFSGAVLEQCKRQVAALVQRAGLDLDSISAGALDTAQAAEWEGQWVLNAELKTGGLSTAIENLDRVARGPDPCPVSFMRADCPEEENSKRAHNGHSFLLTASEIEAERAAGRIGDIPRQLGVEISQHQKLVYYSQVSNGALWSMMHGMIERFAPITEEQWAIYRDVNQAFADSIAEWAQGGGRVWIHDYHLTLTGEMLRRRMPEIELAYFHHIPFPPLAIFENLEGRGLWQGHHRRELVQGLLGNDLVGFHIRDYAANFLDCAAAQGYEVDRQRMTVTVPQADGLARLVKVGIFPISIDCDETVKAIDRIEVQAAAAELRQQFPGEKIFFSVERRDYTKGILEHLEAFALMLEERPDLVGKVRFVQWAPASRPDVPMYREYSDAVQKRVDEINACFRRTLPDGKAWYPIDYHPANLPHHKVTGYARAAHVGVVTPLCDGMNLVAKEFAMACTETEEHKRRDMVLVLGAGAGAARELDADKAIHVDGADPHSVKAGYLRALDLHDAPGKKELRRRQLALEEAVIAHPVQLWTIEILEQFSVALREKQLFAERQVRPAPGQSTLDLSV